MADAPSATFKMPALPLTGGCSCAVIRYRIAAFPLGLYACHCTDCQRQSGSAFAMTMPVATAAFAIVEGAPKAWRRKSGDAEVTAWICGDCGVRIYGERNTRPDSINVRAGTLDDTSWLRPAAHLFIRSAQPWVQFADQTSCFETWPDDFKATTQKWRAQWVA